MIWAADREAAGVEALGHRGRVQRAVPDVGDLAGEQRPGLAPVGAIVVQHLAGALRRPTPPTRCARPDRSPRHTADRSPSDAAARRRAARSTVSSIGGAAADQPVLAEQPDIAEPADRHARAASGVSSSRGSASPERSSASSSSARSRGEPRSKPSSESRRPRAPAARGPSRRARRAGCRR